MRIEGAGVLGTGKTTIASLINSDLVIHEDFDTNPFLLSFYQNPAKYIFKTEFSFLLQHYHQIKKNEQLNKICDFALIQDLAYGRMGLNVERFKIFKNTYKSIIEEIGYPDLLIHLKCKPSIILQRIWKRNREQEKNVDISFVTLLQGYLDKEIEAIAVDNKIKIIEINTGDDDYINNNQLRRDFQKKINSIFS